MLRSSAVCRSFVGRIPSLSLHPSSVSCLRLSSFSSSRSSSLSSSLIRSFSSTPSSPSSSSSVRSPINPIPENRDTQVYPLPSLSIRCDCGSVGINTYGPSSINFVCHCSVCRASTNRPYTSAAAFKIDQITFFNEDNIDKITPPRSKNIRYYCKSCKGYIGENAVQTLGVIAIPLEGAKLFDNNNNVNPLTPSSLNDLYKPNHHIFYDFRVSDFNDSIPKWQTLPEGIPFKKGDKTKTDINIWNQLSKQSIDSSSLPLLKLSFQSNGQWDSNYGWYRKDVQPLSPTRIPESKTYFFTENDPNANHVINITPEKIAERLTKKYYPSPSTYVAPVKNHYDVIIIGGGHNGLVSAAYLAQKKLSVLVLERRHLIGGAAVTEELYPGFKFSRASYLAGLLRPKIIEELQLEKYGFKYLPRDPSSFTPTRIDGPYGGKYLLFEKDEKKTLESIAQFSKKDAENYGKYEEFLGNVRDLIQPLLDGPLPLFDGPWQDKRETWKQIKELGRLAYQHRHSLIPFYELFTAPASHILDRYFESEILKTTLATDSVIGASCSPKHAGSAYVLLHHVMGEAAGRKGVWSYVEGGMGAISNAIAGAAKDFGAEITTNATVKQILYKVTGMKQRTAYGVEMIDGSHIYAPVILSNATPYHTFLELLPGYARDSGYIEDSPLPKDFQHHIRYADYSCGAVKINCAVDKLPNFLCYPTNANGEAGPQHRGTVHFESRMEEIENAQREAAMGIPASRPVIEMTIPSAVDSTLAPPGKHVVQFFIQFAPYDIEPKIGSWADPQFKDRFADRVFRIVDEFAPGFSSSVLYRDILSPLDLERIFGLHKGNIMHGALSLHQLGYARPAFGYARHRTPMKGLYLCGSGAHPGGGVMGAAGRNTAKIVLADLNLLK